MTTLLSPNTASAGLWGPEAIMSATGPIPQASLPLPVSVYQSDGTTLASLYTSQTKAAAGPNPVNTDAYGNLTFYTDPGIYVLSVNVGGILSTRTVQVNPFYEDGAWNVVIDTASASPLPGDCRLANASTAAITETLPSPVIGTRLRIVKTDSSGNAVTVTTPSGVIQGPGLGGGSANYVISAQGAYVELFADGTNYHITGGAGGGGGEVAFTSRAAITTANTFQNGATFTPTQAGRYVAYVTFLIPSGGATVAAQVTYTMAGIAETGIIYPTGQGTVAQGAYSPPPFYFNSDAGTAITVQVQSGSTGTIVTTSLATG